MPMKHTNMGMNCQPFEIDLNCNMLTALKYGVLKAPTLLLFIKGQEAARVMGVVPKKALISQIEPYLG